MNWNDNNYVHYDDDDDDYYLNNDNINNIISNIDVITTAINATTINATTINATATNTTATNTTATNTTATNTITINATTINTTTINATTTAINATATATNTTNTNDIGEIVDTDNSIKEFIGYKNQNICDCWKLCNTCNLMHPLKFFINSQKYCYNCWGWKNAYNFDLEFGKYIICDNDSVQLNEANDILKTVLQFYDKIDNKYKITDSIFNKIIHYEQLGILHEQFSKLLYKKNNLIFTGNKPVKIDYKNSLIFI